MHSKSGGHHISSILLSLHSRLPDHPDQHIARDHGGQREGHAELHEGAGFHVIAFLAQDAQARDVGGSADRGEVAAQGRPGQQAEVQQVAAFDAHARVERGDDRQHRCHIGNVIDEGGEENREPHDHRVHHEEIAIAGSLEEAGHQVDHARLADAGDDHKQAGQQQQGEQVDLLEGADDDARILLDENAAQQADRIDAHADQAVDGEALREAHERGRDQQADGAQQQPGREHIVHFFRGFGLDRPAFFSQRGPKHKGGGYGRDLHDPEHAHLAVHEEEIHEVHTRVAAQQYGGGIAHQRRGALQVGGDGDGDDAGDRGHFELFGDADGHRGHHQHSRHVIHKGGDDRREYGQADDGPLDVGHPVDDQISQAGRHARLDEQRDCAHGAGDHHQHIPVDGRKHIAQGHDAQRDEERGGTQRDPCAVI